MKKEISLKEIDEKFDNDEDVLEYFDKTTATLNQPITTPKKLILEIPVYFVNELDKYSKLYGLTRQGLIKSWLIEKMREYKKELSA